MKERREEGLRMRRKEKRRGRVASTVYYNFLSFFCPYLTLSPPLHSPPFHTGLPFSALTCRGPLAGMVDLSDVRSMSRPCSPLSVFPSPCIMRPVASNQPTHTLIDTKCCPHSREMLMQGWPWSLWKEMTLDARHQAPGRAREDSRGTNKRLIHPAPSLSLCTLSACLSVSFSYLHSLYSPPV